MSEEKHLSYIPQLNALRAIAVILVLFAHWLPTDNNWNKYSGRFGVAIFFVLSGFLISRILFRERQLIESKKQSFKTSLKEFYIKRSLRIFPAYFAILAFVFLLHFFISYHLEGNWYHYFLYISNFYIYEKGHWIGILNHTWSLAVEEQFYLIWPFIILIVNSKYRLLVLVMAIVSSFCFGHFINYLFGSNGFIHILTPACMGSFAIGGILAHYSIKPGGLSKGLSIIFYFTGAIFFLLLVLQHTQFVKFPDFFQFDWMYFSFPSAGILVYILVSKGSWPDRFIFSNKWLFNFGTISYGVYLYHAPIAYIWENTFLAAIGHHFPFSFYTQRLVWLILTLIISQFSWKYLESPILKIKNRLL